MQRVLFLCTGNSGRSQMAEAIVNARMGDTWQAFSAGTRPTGYVHPNAVRALAEIGIDITGARSKSADEFRGAAFDLVVTVCDDAAEELPGVAGARQARSSWLSRPGQGDRQRRTKSWPSFVRCATTSRVQVPALLQEHDVCRQ